MNRLLSVIARRPGWVLVGVLAVTLLAASGIVSPRTGELRLDFDPSTNALLPEEDEARDFYDFTRRLFGSDETILVALVDDDVFTADNLRAIGRMGERIKEVDGVHHVVSLANALDIRSEGGDLVISPSPRPCPTTPPRWRRSAGARSRIRSTRATSSPGTAPRRRCWSI